MPINTYICNSKTLTAIPTLYKPLQHYTFKTNPTKTTATLCHPNQNSTLWQQLQRYDNNKTMPITLTQCQQQQRYDNPVNTVTTMSTLWQPRQHYDNNNNKTLTTATTRLWQPRQHYDNHINTMTTTATLWQHWPISPAFPVRFVSICFAVK